MLTVNLIFTVNYYHVHNKINIVCIHYILKKILVESLREILKF